MTFIDGLGRVGPLRNAQGRHLGFPAEFHVWCGKENHLTTKAGSATWATGPRNKHLGRGNSDGIHAEGLGGGAWVAVGGAVVIRGGKYKGVLKEKKCSKKKCA